MRLFIAIVSLLLAATIHLFYIDYQVDGENYIYSWPATKSQRRDLQSKYDRRFGKNAIDISKRVVLFGGRPSERLGASYEKAFWLGVIVPLSLAAFSMLVLLPLQLKSTSPPKPQGEKKGPEPRSNLKSRQNVQRPKEHRQQSLAELLIQHFGQNFPVSSGEGTELKPLMVTAKADYVSVEYAVAEYVFGQFREEYQLANQSLASEGDRKIDRLTFNIKPSDTKEWTEQRNLYFDITIGFDQLSGNRA